MAEAEAGDDAANAEIGDHRRPLRGRALVNHG
jgi:hypothetical protein